MKTLTVEDRIVGAMLGLACGDALGAPLEFKSRDEAERQGLLPMTDLVGGGLWLPGEWTDDTAMTLAVAEGIIASPTDPVVAIGVGFLAWFRSGPKDVGSTISAALRAYASPSVRGSWAEASRNTPQAQSGKAAGNGSLMRTLPVALAYPNSQDIAEQGARLSAMTHWDAQAETCCLVYCLWVSAMLDGRPASEAWRAALGVVRDTSAFSPGAGRATPGLVAPGDALWTRLAFAACLNYTDLQPSGYAGYCVETLEAAAWCVLNAKDAEEAIVSAANLCGEADTIAAVAGGAAGAAWGVQSLPSRWLDNLRDAGRVRDAAAGLLRVREER